MCQGRRKHLKLGGQAHRGHFFLTKKGLFSKMKRALLCLLPIFFGGGHVYPVVPGSYVNELYQRYESCLHSRVPPRGGGYSYIFLYGDVPLNRVSFSGFRLRDRVSFL